jgi:ParB family chromosome partitioning protein
VIDAAEEAMGGRIELDPASCELAQETVRAERYYSWCDDGLPQSWDAERLWLNPPYTRGLIAPWIDKLLREVELRRVGLAICIVNTSSSTLWWQDLVSRSTVICFPSPRIKFLDEDGLVCPNPRYDSTIAMLGHKARARVLAFDRAFSPHGFVTAGGDV